MAIEITSKDNQAVKAAAKLMASARERRQTGRFIAEGIRLCTEVLENHCKIVELFYTEDAYQRYTETVERLERAAGKSYQITDEIAEKIADTVTPQGVFVVAEMIVNTIDLATIKTDGQFVLLENLQDPGNVGAIFRTAEALGLNGAFLTADSCDPYNPKAIRASMGAVFRTPVVQTDWATAQNACADAGICVAVTALSERAQDLRQAELDKMAVVIGSEGRGVRKEILENARAELIIPMNERCESLNAAIAAAIVMWQMRQ